MMMSLVLKPSTDRRRDHRTQEPRSRISGKAELHRSVSSNATASANSASASSIRAPRLPETNARAVLKLARQRAGKSPDIATAQTALAQAAADQRVVLTAHPVAMVRAGDAAARLNSYMDSLRGTGRLREFTKEFKRGRIAANMRGEGFMSFSHAELRLRRALIPLLMGGGQPAIGQSLFAEIFKSL
jgi:hypothetical protein